MDKRVLTDKLTKLYLYKCTSEGAFINKKLNRAYYGIRRHFDKEDLNVLRNLMLYLNNADASCISIAELYANTKEFIALQKLEHDLHINSQLKPENEVRYSAEKFVNL